MDKKQFTIKIENLVPTLVDVDAKIPCDNDGYSINFDFDDDWGNYLVKTGIFVCGGATHTSVFKGNVCKIPKIKDGTVCYIGVVTGEITEENAIPDKKTSIWCEVEAVPTITSIANEPSAPSPDVYVEFMALLNKYITEGGGGGGLTEEQVKAIVVTETRDKYVAKIEPDVYGVEYLYSTVGLVGGGEPFIEHKLTPLTNEPRPNTAAQRNGDGSISVAPATKEENAVNLKQLEEYVEEHTLPHPDYIESINTGAGWIPALANNGTVKKYQVYTTAGAYTLPLRAEGGGLAVGTPTQDDSATPKKYVDDADKANANKIADNTKRIEKIEGTLVTYIEDDAAAYEKEVPVGVGGNAILSSIGGVNIPSTTTNNLIDPRIFGFPVKGDGSFRFTYDFGGGGQSLTSITIDLPIGTYYITLNKSNIVGKSDSFSVYFLGQDENGFEIRATTLTLNEPTTCDIYMEAEGQGEVNLDAYIMLSTEPNAEFESYFEHGKVTAVESYGSNLFNPQWLIDYDAYAGGLEIYGNGVKVTDAPETTNISFAKFMELTGLKVGDTFTTQCKMKMADGKVPSERHSISFDGVFDIIDITPITITITEDMLKYQNLKVFASYASTSNPAFITDIMVVRGDTITDYKPYSAEPIDTFVIPVDIQALNGYGKDGFVLDLDSKTVTYEGEVTDVSAYLTDYANFKFIEVQGGGRVRFVNEHEYAVPSEITYAKVKE